ncbi:hypothetical protein ACFOM8_02145 [Paracoccus angustae]|uniref:Uncharacterized protein n=1 Tax=Paracoccus angustae TaxID=1671480 RepID=A0ABV7TZN7_9RHOB
MSAPRLSPRSQAIAFRAWAWCQTHGWEQTLQEIAEGIDESQQSVSRVFVLKGWMTRVRKMTADYEVGAYHVHTRTAGDHDIDELRAWS